MIVKEKKRRMKTDCTLNFLFWFPELDKCPVCKKGRTIFDNFRVKKITIETEGRDDVAPGVFIYKKETK